MEISERNKQLLGEMVRWVTGVPELQQALEIISNEIRRLSSSRRVTAEEVQSLGSYLTQVQLLMNDLYRSENEEDIVSKRNGERVQIMGLIKVLRNDLERITVRINSTNRCHE